MKKIKKHKIIFLFSLILCLTTSSITALGKENPNTIEFLTYNEGTVILKSSCETIVISEGNNSDEFLSGISKEKLSEINLLVLRSTKDGSNELIKEVILNSNVKKILLPTLEEISEEVKKILNDRNVEIVSMEEGFNYNKESISLNAKRVEESKEGMIFATVDNIKVAILSEESYEKTLELSETRDCRVEILNVNKIEGNDSKKIIKRLNPLVIIENSANSNSPKKIGLEYYNLNEEEGLKITRVLGETKAFQVLSKKEGYTK